MTATTRSPTAIDQHVGARLRLRRSQLDMSQSALADKLGVTFQQVQKYERGTNRVGASRLWLLAKVLEVPVQFFFEGLGEDGEPTSPCNAVYDFIQSSDGLAMAEAFSAIPQAQVRRRMIDLARALSVPA